MQFVSQQEQGQPPPSVSQQEQPAQIMYFAIGHGVSNTSILINNTNVILIKKERCGYLSRVNETYEDAAYFSNNFSTLSNLEIFSKDYHFQRLTGKLSQFVKNKTMTRPSEQFVDGIFTPLADFNLKSNQITLCTSGLYSNAHQINKKCIVLTKKENESIITAKNINIIFNNSLYPTPTRVMKLFDSLKEDTNYVRFQLFKDKFMKFFNISIFKLLTLCNKLSGSRISILYYPPCRKIQGLSLADSQKEGLKLSDEVMTIQPTKVDDESSSSSSQESNNTGGMGIITRKRRKRMTRKLIKTRHRKNKK
jgi:hypothetical protein